MKTHLGITIKEPCQENWQEMTPTTQGKHCASCKREVIDFTSLTKKEIHTRIIKGESICGRFRKDQLNTPLYFEPTKVRQWKKYAASLLFPAALFMTNDSDAQTPAKEPFTCRLPLTTQTVKPYDSLGIGSLSRKQENLNPELHCISGIISANNSVLASVIIQIKGTHNSVKTGLDGEYQITAAKGDTLIFSLEGFENQEIVYTNQKSISINLRESIIPYNDFIMGDIVIDNLEDYQKKQ